MRDYQAIINEVIEVINNNIRYGKSHREIIQAIGDLLASYGLNDVRHFDRVYFKAFTNKSLSNYIKDELFNSAVEYYEKIKDSTKKKFNGVYFEGIYEFKKKYIRNKGGDNMGRYVCFFQDTIIDDISYLSNKETNNEFIVVSAVNKIEAKRKYIAAEYNSQQLWYKKLSIMEQFCENSLTEGESFLSGFEKKDELEEIRRSILNVYNEDDDIWQLIPQNKELECQMNNLYNLLSLDERFNLYYENWDNRVICLELTSFSEYKKFLDKKRKNINPKITSNDICILNTLARLIRQDSRSKKYPITKDTFLKQGYNGEEAEKLFELLRFQIVNQVISEDIDFGFSYSRLITSYESRGEGDNEVVYVVLEPLLYYLASKGYDFRERRSERLLKLVSEFRELEDNKSN